MSNSKNTNEMKAQTISEFSLALCAGIRKPYYNGNEATIYHKRYIENEKAMVFFSVNGGQCQNARVNEFIIK